MSKQRSFVIKPNPAMSWHYLLIVFSIMATITLLIGIILYFMGYTLVLPYCGLDVIALGVALYLSAKKGRQREVVTLSEGKIAVEAGYDHPESRLEFTDPWTKIILHLKTIIAGYLVNC